jgi:hypothetical protein
MVDIYSLFKREEKVEISDGTNKIEVLLKKPNVGEEEKISKETSKSRDTVVSDAMNNATTQNEIKSIIQNMTEENKYNYILNNEEYSQRNVMDIAPIGDRNIMIPEEITAGEDEFIVKWRKKRLEEVKKLPVNELEDKIRTLMIDLRGMLIASDVYNKNLLLYTVRKLDGTRLFKSMEDLNNIDTETFNLLKDKISKFVNKLSQQEIRKAAQEESFLSSTESGKSTTDSPPTKI